MHIYDFCVRFATGGRVVLVDGSFEPWTSGVECVSKARIKLAEKKMALELTLDH